MDEYFPPIFVAGKLKEENELSNGDQIPNSELRLLWEPTVTSKILLMFAIVLLTFHANQTFPSSKSFL